MDLKFVRNSLCVHESRACNFYMNLQLAPVMWSMIFLGVIFIFWLLLYLKIEMFSLGN